MKYYSPKTKGFYDDEFNTVPSDAIQLTDQEYQHFFTSLCSGKDLVHDNGRLLVIDREIPLDDLKQSKIKEINDAFQDAEQQPVGVGGYKFKGGFTSALALDGERRGIIEENNAIIAGFLPGEPAPDLLHTTVTFFTVDGVLAQVPLFDTEQIDAVDVCQAVRMQASYNSFKCERLKAAAKAAKSIEELAAIKW